MSEMQESYKKGYLNEDFRLFHLRDSLGQSLDYHYHDFDKIVIFISGRVDYIVEGVTYPLRSMDVLLVGHHCLHKAVIDLSEPYERIVIYLDTGFAQRSGTEKTALLECFETARERGFCLLRQESRAGNETGELLERLEQALTSERFGADVLARSYFLQLMVHLNRLSRNPPAADGKAVRYDPRISAVLGYISENLTSDLSVDALAARCYFSRYHFMRRFREMTGCTVHNYIRKKRLLCAASLIKEGTPAVRAAALSGFNDYSAFTRAFKGEFGTAPSMFTGNMREELPERE